MLCGFGFSSARGESAEWLLPVSASPQDSGPSTLHMRSTLQLNDASHLFMHRRHTGDPALVRMWILLLGPNLILAAIIRA